MDTNEVRYTYKQLRYRAGFTEDEAGTLAAHLTGLRKSPNTGWKLKEVERLLFIRAMVERGRLSGERDR